MIYLLGFASNSHFLHLRCLHAAFPAATAACRSGTLVPRLSQAPSLSCPEWCVLHMHKVKRLQFFYIANVLNLNFCSQTYCRRSNSIGSIILEFLGDRKIHTANQRLVCTDEKARGQVARRFLLL